MKISTTAYVPAESPVHSCDARVKILLLFAFTICIFFANSWAGILAFAAMTLLAMAVSRVPAGNYFKTLVPVYVLMAFSIACNMFVGEDALAAFGPVSVTASGLSRGCFLALRILMLCLASMVVSFTTTSTELTGGLARMMRPLRLLHIPVDDVSATLAIALRFIPLLAHEVERVHDTHCSRCARFDGTVMQRLQAWGKVFLSVFVRLFRQADHLSSSMDARCYGMPGVQRTASAASSLGVTSGLSLVIGVALFATVAALL